MNEEALLNLLYDHYKDSFSQIRERERQRDRLFLVVFGLIGLLVLQLDSSLLLQQTVSEIDVAGVKIDLSKIPIAVFLSTSWAFLSVFLLRYYQVTIHIEKLYDYLHPLEARISKAFGEDNLIARESTAYETKKASFFREWAWVFYTYLFPAIVCVSVVWSLFIEWNTMVIPLSHKCIDSVLGVMVLGSILLFIIASWLKR